VQGLRLLPGDLRNDAAGIGCGGARELSSGEDGTDDGRQEERRKSMQTEWRIRILGVESGGGGRRGAWPSPSPSRMLLVAAARPGQASGNVHDGAGTLKPTKQPKRLTWQWYRIRTAPHRFRFRLHPSNHSSFAETSTAMIYPCHNFSGTDFITSGWDPENKN